MGKFLVLTILSRMDEVVNECEVAKCLESVLDALVEEVAVEEFLLRPPGDGDVGQTMCWVNHFGEVENVHVRANVVARQDVVNVSAVLLVDSMDGSRSCFETVPLIQSCDLFRCWCVVVISFKVLFADRKVFCCRGAGPRVDAALKRDRLTLTGLLRRAGRSAMDERSIPCVQTDKHRLAELKVEQRKRRR